MKIARTNIDASFAAATGWDWSGSDGQFRRTRCPLPNHDACVSFRQEFRSLLLWIAGSSAAGAMLQTSGWGARIRTWDGGTKTRCLTAWLRPNAWVARTAGLQ